MTIHVIGAQETNYPWGVENKLIPALQALGHEVISTDFRKHRETLNQKLAQPADLVLICKGENIPASLIESIPCLTALWYAEQIGTESRYDDTALARRKELAVNVHAFDTVFSHDQANLDLFKQLGARQIFWLPCAAVDPSIHQKLESVKSRDVVFVGSKTPYRDSILSQLSEAGIEVHHPEIWAPVEMNQMFNESKIVLNIHLSELLNTETRVAEVLGSGAFLLSETLSSPDLIKEGVHFAEWKSGDVPDLVEKIKHYLSNQTEREKIAQNGHDFIHENYTYEKLMGQALSQIDFDYRKKIWPSYQLGIPFDSGHRPTLRLEKFYDAVANVVQNLKKPKAVAVSSKSKGPITKSSNEKLRIFAAFAQVNWEENNLQPALDEFGEVIRFKWDFHLQYLKDWHQRSKSTVNKMLVEAVEKAHMERPIDVFFGYVSGRVVFPETIRRIEEMGIRTLSLSLDDQIKFYGKKEPSGYSGMAEIAPAFSLCWTSTESSIDKYKEVGARVIYMPAGANPKVYRPYDVPRDVEVSFIGQKYGMRPNVVEDLQSRDIPIQAFGKGWDGGEIPVEEMVKLYSRSRITLGFGTVGDSEAIICLKGRDFEVPMSGGFYLTQYNHELEPYFKLGEEIVCYQDLDDMAEKIRYYLDHPDEAEAIRKAGYERSIAEHTWVKRFRTAFEEMGVL